jgi:hypothetical protein
MPNLNNMGEITGYLKSQQAYPIGTYTGYLATMKRINDTSQHFLANFPPA